MIDFPPAPRFKFDIPSLLRTAAVLSFCASANAIDSVPNNIPGTILNASAVSAQDCIANVEYPGGELNPYIAQRCLKQHDVIESISALAGEQISGAEYAARIRSLNALRTSIISMPCHPRTNDSELYTIRLSSILSDSPTLRKLSLNRSDNFLQWVKKYFPDQYKFLKITFMSWNTLCEEEREWLKASGNRHKWKNLSYAQRAELLESFEENGTETAVAGLPKHFSMTFAELLPVLTRLSEYSGEAHLPEAELLLHLNFLQKLTAAARAEQLDISCLSELTTLTFKDQLEIYKNFFASKDIILSLDQVEVPGFDAEVFAERLPQLMRDAIKGTSIGELILEFYDDPSGKYSAKGGGKPVNRLSVSVKSIQSTAQFFYKGNKIVFNKDLIKTTAYLLSFKYPKEHIPSQLASYFAPSFIHEALHQIQTVQCRINNIPPDIGSQENEVEAKLASIIYILEKYDTDAAIPVDPSDIIYLNQTLHRGIPGLRRLVNHDYWKTPTLDEYYTYKGWTNAQEYTKRSSMHEMRMRKLQALFKKAARRSGAQSLRQ